MRRLAFSLLLMCLVLGLSNVQATASYQGTPPPVTVGGRAPATPPPGFTDPNALVTVMVRLAATPVAGAQSVARAAAAATQDRVASALERRGAQVLFRTRLLYNGVAVAVRAHDVPGLRQIVGVADAQIITPQSQPEHAITSAISASLTQVAPTGVTGANVRVGVIDSGIDYMHADFGGAGQSAAYAANDRTLIEPGSFPTAKVVGGYDFAGDAYDAAGLYGSTTPSADADPLDCHGRGTHIAGVIAGVGVTEGGTAFAGPYTPTSDYSAFQVPPGVAPQASLYALKVFGCAANASTTLTIQALEWALDPNGDGDIRDHLDAVVIALGTPYGSPDDPDALAIEQAVKAGMVVITAAGDGEGSFYSVNSFGTAPGAIAVGASVGSPVPLNASDETYTDPSCFVSGDLVGNFVTPGIGTITNASTNCTYQVGIASYRKFDENIDHQQIYQWATAKLAPGQSATLEAGLPDCAAQIDLFRGPVLHSLNGRRYNTRLIVARHVDSMNYCPAQSAPVYGVPASAARGIEPGNATLKPDMVAPSIGIRSAAVAGGTSAATESASWVGAAQVAGAVALLRQRHADWSPERVKTVLMNTAAAVLMDDNTLYPPSFVGAGQIDLSRLTATGLVAYGDQAESAALSYGAPIMSQLWHATRTLHLENSTNKTATVTLNTVAAATEAGVDINLPAAPITVPAGSTVDVPIDMVIDPAQLDATPDAATVLPVQNDALAQSRYYAAEHSGYVQISDANSQLLRVPFIVLPRAASDSSASDFVVPAEATAFSLGVTNNGARNAASIGGNANPHVALVSAFELLGSSGQRGDLANTARTADLRYLGVTSDLADSAGGVPAVLYVGLATFAPWSTPNEVQFRLLIDTNADDRADFALVNIAWPDKRGRETDVFQFALYSLQPDGTLGAYLGQSAWDTLLSAADSPYVDVAPFNTSVAFAALDIGSLKLPGGQTQIRLRLESRARGVAGFTTIVDQIPDAGWLSYDLLQPAIAPFVPRGPFAYRPLFIDATGSLITGAVNPAVITQRGGQKLLLLHHHNVPDQQAQLVDVRVAGIQLLSPGGAARTLYIPMTGR